MGVHIDNEHENESHSRARVEMPQGSDHRREGRVEVSRSPQELAWQRELHAHFLCFDHSGRSTGSEFEHAPISWLVMQCDE